MQDHFKDFLKGKPKIEIDKTTEEKQVIEEWTQALQELVDQVSQWLAEYQQEGLMEVNQEMNEYKSPIFRGIIKYPSVSLKVKGHSIYFKPQTGGFFKNIIREVFIHAQVNQDLRQLDLIYDDAKTWKLKIPEDPFNKNAELLTEDVLKKIIQELVS
jgi:hypothetical protein